MQAKRYSPESFDGGILVSSSVPYRKEGAVLGKAITIDREQRNGLYEVVRNHLGGIEDLWTALEQTKDYAAAERLGLEFAEDIRLLQDLGWAEGVDHESFELTMPPLDLTELLRRLHGEAAQVLIPSGSEAQLEREDADTNRGFQRGYETCAQVLADLGPQRDEQA